MSPEAGCPTLCQAENRTLLQRERYQPLSFTPSGILLGKLISVPPTDLGDLAVCVEFPGVVLHHTKTAHRPPAAGHRYCINVVQSEAEGFPGGSLLIVKYGFLARILSQGVETVSPAASQWSQARASRSS